jgi:hypothetical protein
VSRCWMAAGPARPRNRGRARAWSPLEYSSRRHKNLRERPRAGAVRLRAERGSGARASTWHGQRMRSTRAPRRASLHAAHASGARASTCHRGTNHRHTVSALLPHPRPPGPVPPRRLQPEPQHTLDARAATPPQRPEVHYACARHTQRNNPPPTDGWPIPKAISHRKGIASGREIVARASTLLNGRDELEQPKPQISHGSGPGWTGNAWTGVK